MFLAIVSTASLVVTRIGQCYEKRAQKLTEQADTDGDGFVTKEELKASMRSMKRSLTRKRIDQFTRLLRLPILRLVPPETQQQTR